MSLHTETNYLYMDADRENWPPAKQYLIFEFWGAAVRESLPSICISVKSPPKRCNVLHVTPLFSFPWHLTMLPILFIRFLLILDMQKWLASYKAIMQKYWCFLSIDRVRWIRNKTSRLPQVGISQSGCGRLGQPQSPQSAHQLDTTAKIYCSSLWDESVKLKLSLPGAGEMLTWWR